MKIIADSIDKLIWTEARLKWGLSHEAGMATEELAETITAINHMRRDRWQGPEEYIDELADACICNFQIIHNNRWWDEFNEALARSREKLEKKLEADNLNEGHT